MAILQDSELGSFEQDSELCSASRRIFWPKKPKCQI